MKTLRLQDYQSAAKRLNTGIAEVWSVTQTESSGRGFDDKGRVILRFEPHIFSRYSKGVYDSQYPAFSFPKRKKGYPKDVDQSWQLFKQAALVKPNVAVLACSWGMFQIMAFNYSACGCESLTQFVARMENSEADQLDMFCTFLINSRLDGYLRNHQDALLARYYNGEDYEENEYDQKLAHFRDTFKLSMIPV